jgi:endonuclease/exonuclease/phosphatase family metal-dependent hydrolase
LPEELIVLIFRYFVFVLLSGFFALKASAQDAEPMHQTPLKVMTYNIRYAAKDAHPWTKRRPVTAAMINATKPDLIGTQEGLFHQIKEMAFDLPAYDWIGLGRDGGSRGELMAIFYRKERFEPLEYDHFWLSDTPEVMGSSTWGNQNIRMVTWVKFLDRLTNQQFYFWNTHFDHVSQNAREEAAKLIVRRVNALNTKLPIILTGDFNAPAKANKVYDILTAEGFGGDFTDTWFSAAKRIGDDFSTFHGYKAPTPNGAHIDWILTRGAVADETSVVTFEQEGQRPSDHFPVMATLRLKSTPQP